MNLIEYLLYAIPKWVSEKKIYMQVKSKNGMVVAAIPVVSNLTPGQIIELMEDQSPFFEKFVDYQVLKEEKDSITISWEFIPQTKFEEDK